MSMPKTLTVCGIRLRRQRVTIRSNDTEVVYQGGGLYGEVRFNLPPFELTTTRYIEIHSHGHMMLIADGKTWRKALSNLNLLRFSMLDKAADDLSAHQPKEPRP